MLERQRARYERMAAATLAAVCLAFGFVGSPEAAAQEAAKKAAEAPKADAAKNAADDAEKAAPMQVTVVSVSGVAQKRAMANPNGRWEPVKPGDALNEQTLIRTGLASKVVLHLTDRGRVTVKSGTKVGIGTFRKRGKVVRARLGLKYGSMRARVDGARGPNDLQVSTPVAVLTVRGCGANLGIDERGLRFCVFEHQWDVMTADGRQKRVREKECTDQDLKPWRKMLGELNYVCMADPGGGQDAEDRDSLLENADGRAILDFSAGDRGRWLFGIPMIGSPQNGNGGGVGAGNGPNDGIVGPTGPNNGNVDMIGGNPRR